MNFLLSDYGNWMNMLKGNYRKGANTLRGILTNPDAAEQMIGEDAAIMAIYGDVDYSDGSCWCADVIGNTDYAPDAFNRYLNLIGVSTDATWAESSADTSVLQGIAGNPTLLAIVQNSPSLSIKRTLSSDSWETISANSVSGIASLVYSLKDTKDISLSGIGTMTLEIADFNHDYLTGNTSADKAGITFLTKDLLYQTYQMNSSNTDVGGFPDSALYDTLSGTIWNALPSDLRDVVKTIYKWYGTGNSTTNGQWLGSKIWVPLEYEMFGSTTFAPATEQTTGNARQYPIFTDNASRVKRMNNGAGSSQAYWEASPRTSGAPGFCYVGGGGNANNHSASTSIGVCFGLAV